MLNRVRSDTGLFADLLMIMDVHSNVNLLNCIMFKLAFLQVVQMLNYLKFSEKIAENDYLKSLKYSCF